MLLGPVERQIEFGQTSRRKLDRLPALQDCLDQLWAQEGQTNKTPDVAPADPIALGQLLQRSRAAADQLAKPRSSACNRLDQRRIALRRMVVLCVEKHQPGPDTAPLDADGRGQLDSASGRPNALPSHRLPIDKITSLDARFRCLRAVSMRGVMQRGL